MCKTIADVCQPSPNTPGCTSVSLLGPAPSSFSRLSTAAIYRASRCFSEGGGCSSDQVVFHPADDTMNPFLVAVTDFIVLLNFFLKVEGVDVGEVVFLQKAIPSNVDSAIKPSPLDLRWKVEACEQIVVAYLEREFCNIWETCPVVTVTGDMPNCFTISLPRLSCLPCRS